jgi:hypothetical protein
VNEKSGKNAAFSISESPFQVYGFANENAAVPDSERSCKT